MPGDAQFLLQATLAGRFGTSEYGLSKRDGEELFFRYAEETGATVYVYRFPNLVGNGFGQTITARSGPSATTSQMICRLR